MNSVQRYLEQKYQVKVDWLTYYKPQRNGIDYKVNDSWVAVRGAQYRANRKKMSHAVLMAELWKATAEYCHAVMTGVGVDEAGLWLQRWDRIVGLEEESKEN